MTKDPSPQESELVQPRAANQWQVLGYCLAGAVVVILGLLTARRNKDYRNDLSIWNDTANKQPSNCRAFNNRGMAYIIRGKPEKAVRDFNQAIKLNPTYRTAYSNRGLEYAKKGKGELAIRDYTKAIELDPNYAIAYYNRALAHLRKGDRSQARRDFKQAIKLAPNLSKLIKTEWMNPPS